MAEASVKMGALPDLAGHQALRASLAAAFLDGALPQSILIHGPQGVGKERLGLWLAQLIVCDTPSAEPCGRCNNCRLVPRLEHPDVHWFFPLPRPTASSPEKLRERLEEHRAEELQQYRETPLRIAEHEKAPAHFLAAVRTMHKLASMRPASGNHGVFVIGDAELMVPQESSPEAANAFLKLLEEPPPTATIVLTSSQPGALLPTIRSRVFSARALLVPEPAIASLLVNGGLAEAEVAGRIAARARGSVRRAIRLAAVAEEGGTDPERVAGRKLLLAALASGAELRLKAANDSKPIGARVALVGELESLALWLRDLAAVAAGDPDHVANPDDLPLLTRMVERRDVSAEAVIRAMRHLSTARDLALGNVNPQLIVAVLLANLQAELVGTDARAGSDVE